MDKISVEVIEALVEHNRNKEWQYLNKENKLEKIPLCKMPTMWLKKIRNLLLKTPENDNQLKRRDYFLSSVLFELEYRYQEGKTNKETVAEGSLINEKEVTAATLY